MTIDRETLSVMDPLYDQLLQQKFASSTDAIEFCREACQEYGFSIKQETNSNRSIYLYCAQDNPLLSDALEQQTPPLRKRPSSLKNASSAPSAEECKWRVVLTENELTNEWTFRKSLDPQASEHNHLLSDNEPSIWPQKVYDRIIQLARQKNMQTADEMRDTIKLQFPDITWNDRRFSNCLVQERKRMRQKGVTDKVQRLVMASTRLCSVVAANEDWASCVEGELVKMLENYKHLSRIPNQQMVDSMVDLQLDMIHSEIDKNRRPHSKQQQQQQYQEDDMFGKKRRTSASAALRNEGIQVMSVPSCTLYIRSQPLRSLSEPSSQNRRAFTDLIAASSASAIPQQHHHHQQQHHQQQHHHHHHQQQQHRHHPQQQQQHHPHHHHQQLPFGVSSVFTMTSPVSSPSSTSSLQQRVDYNSYRSSGNNNMLQSPPMPDSANMIMSSGYSGGGNDAYTPHPSTPSSNYNGSAAAAAAAVAAATGDINFNFDPNAMTNTTPSYPQHVPASPAPLVVHRQQQQQQQQPATERMAGYPTSMGYYSNASSSIVREASPSTTTSIQQRIMLQQEYEQHQRHLQQMESSSAAAAVAAAAVANVHLPLIRSNSPLNATMAHQHQQQQQHQQQAHHHPGSHLNPQHWS